MGYEIIDFEKRDLPEIVFSKQIIGKLKLEDLSFEIRSGFKSQYFKEKEYWVCSDGDFAYLQNKSVEGEFNYYKSKDWTKVIHKNLPLQNYLARLEDTKIVNSKFALYPDWSNVYRDSLDNVAISIRDSSGLFLFLGKSEEENKLKINLYERNLKDKNKLVKIITLADFSLK
jgi:hypothetical protein